MLYICNMKKASENLVWDALANDTRRQILDLLKQKPRTTGEIAMKFRNLDRCTVMLHLSVLTEAGLVIAKREGKFRWNYLDVEPIQRIYERWLSSYAQPAAALITRLKDDLEVG
ncbi:MAG: helix-turn-helix domain-containing protein [Bdellovibrionota bacterium]